MKRKNIDLLLKSLKVIFEVSNKQDDGNSYLQELGNFVWYLSVARQDELDEVYNFIVEDEQYWNLSVEVQAIFGRVYSASLVSSDQAKALEVSNRLLRPNCDPIEWEDTKDGLALKIDDKEWSKPLK